MKDMFSSGGEMKDIYFYSSINSWQNEAPEGQMKGIIRNKTDRIVEIEDEEGFTQIINLDKLFCLVY